MKCANELVISFPGRVLLNFIAMSGQEEFGAGARTPAEVAFDKLRAVSIEAGAVKMNATRELDLWLTTRGKDFVVGPERTPFDLWRLTNKCSLYVVVALMCGNEVRRKGRTYQCMLAHDDRTFITRIEHNVAYDLIEFCHGIDDGS